MQHNRQTKNTQQIVEKDLKIHTKTQTQYNVSVKEKLAHCSWYKSLFTNFKTYYFQ